MRNIKNISDKFVVCIDNKGYPASLEPHKIYRILVPDADAEECGQLRIIDERGDDYLYPAKWFASVIASNSFFVG
ncbi:MAG: hypothetical protein JRJ44_06100 [Deltaproteobacteria bacterium]|nr:hypothetical protein [Deltaproteobacteria bacterium]